MKKICLISGVQLWPPESGGQWRTAALAQSLAEEGFHVSVYSLTGRKADYLARLPSQSYQRAPRLREYVNRTSAPAVAQWLCYRLKLPDLWHLIPQRPPAELVRLAKKSDVVIVDFPFLAKHLRIGDGLKILNTHNLEHERWRANFFERWLLSPLVRRTEIQAGKKADLLFVTSPREAEFYGGDLGHCHVIPNGITADRFAVDRESRREWRRKLELGPSDRAILFSASQYGPNADALEFLKIFCEREASALKKMGICFLVVGSVAAQASRNGALLTTGRVPHVEPYFAAADWAINPVDSGSGTNLKMSEYLAAGLPILSTHFGKRGFHLKDGSDYLSFKRGSLLKAIRKMCRLTKPEAKRLAQSARKKNAGHFDMRQIVRRHVLPILTQPAPPAEV